jgi:hypothetical protein
MTTLRLKKSIDRSHLRLGFILISMVLVCSALSPAPDGGYPNGNTAEGDNALFSLTTGDSNTAIGASALQSNTSGYWWTRCGGRHQYELNRAAQQVVAASPARQPQKQAD